VHFDVQVVAADHPARLTAWIEREARKMFTMPQPLGLGIDKPTVRPSHTVGTRRQRTVLDAGSLRAPSPGRR
jgi:hypothetical protein